MGLRARIKADIAANRNNKKGLVIVVSYRIANYIHFSKNLLIRILGYPLIKFYHWVYIWLLGIEIPENTKIGSGLQVWHGAGLVINHQAVIGSNVLLRHCVTIGNKGEGTGVPILGNNVQVGANSVIIGEITIGNNVVIGAGSVVTKSIPNNCVAYGNPAKFKQKA
jgi:putative colanic acid biosynthesis acetyltransferase WcaB